MKLGVFDIETASVAATVGKRACAALLARICSEPSRPELNHPAERQTPGRALDNLINPPLDLYATPPIDPRALGVLLALGYVTLVAGRCGARVEPTPTGLLAFGLSEAT